MGIKRVDRTTKRRFYVTNIVIVLIIVSLLANTFILASLMLDQTRDLETSVNQTQSIVNANIRTLSQAQRELLRLQVLIERGETDPQALDLQRAFVVQRMRESTLSYQLQTLGTEELLELARSYAETWETQAVPLVEAIIANPTESDDERASLIPILEELERNFNYLVSAGEINRKTQTSEANQSARNALNTTSRLLTAFKLMTAVFVVAAIISAHNFFRFDRQREQAAREIFNLTEQARKLSEVASRTSNMVIITDAEGAVEWVNDAFTEITGYSLNEVVGKRPGDVLQGPDTDPVVIEYMRNQLRRQQGFSCEILNYTKQGLPYWVQIETKPVQGEAGEILNFVAIESDVTERRKAEQALLSSERRMRAVMENAPVILYALDHEGRFTFLEGKGLTSTDLDPKQTIGQSIFEVYADAPDVLENIRYGLAGNEFAAVSDIQGTMFEYSATPIQNAKGDTTGLIGIASDVTERFTIEHELASTNARLSTILENLQAGLLVINPDKTISMVNQEFGTMFDLQTSTDTISGLPYTELIVRTRHLFDEATHVETETERILSDQTPRLQTIPLADGRTLERAYIPFSVYDSQTSHMFIYRDITERIQNEQELIEALAKEKELNELKSRFVSMASHEFRTPLAIISSTASFLEMAGARLADEKRQHRFDKIQTAVERMTTLLDDVLLFGKADAGHLEFNPESIHMHTYLSEFIEDQRATLRGSHQLHYHNSCPDLVLYADEKLLRQVISNLVSNAVKYSPDGSVINVHLSRNEDDMILVVQDSGMGIPIADQKHLFEPFHRATNVKQIQGTGLGLAIASKAIEAHQGRIEFESKPGEGTTFTVHFPSFERSEPRQ